MRRINCTGLFLFAILVPAAYASDGHFKYARVIDAEPITVSERVPVRKQVCARPSDVSPPGDARRDRPRASIGELIRADSRQRRPDCRNITRYEKRQKTVGWRVTYRYAGTEYVQRMKQKPGERIRVRIDTDAG